MVDVDRTRWLKAEDHVHTGPVVGDTLPPHALFPAGPYIGPDAYKPIDEQISSLTIIHLSKGGWVVEGYDAPALRAQYAAFTCLQDALDWMAQQLAYRGEAQP